MLSENSGSSSQKVHLIVDLHKFSVKDFGLEVEGK